MLSDEGRRLQVATQNAANMQDNTIIHTSRLSPCLAVTFRSRAWAGRRCSRHLATHQVGHSGGRASSDAILVFAFPSTGKAQVFYRAG